VDRDDALRFKRMIFRATKGNSWIVVSDIEYPKHDIALIQEEDDKTGQPVARGPKNPRSVFIVVYQGGMNDFLK